MNVSNKQLDNKLELLSDQLDDCQSDVDLLDQRVKQIEDFLERLKDRLGPVEKMETDDKSKGYVKYFCKVFIDGEFNPSEVHELLKKKIQLEAGT